MWYKNIAGRFFGLVTKHARDRRTDGRTDRITTPKTALSIARAVKIAVQNAGALLFGGAVRPKSLSIPKPGHAQALRPVRSCVAP